MKVFLSYSSSHVDLAARMARSLTDEGDDVFFDRQSLPVGDTYQRRIREAIEGCDVFLFLVSAEAISSGSYALAELEIAERLSTSGAPRVVPVMASTTDFAAMPPYLRSITVLQPRGEMVAETLAAVADIRRELKRDHVSVSMMVSNSGWILSFLIIDGRPREIFYRFAEEADFTSTGLSQFPDLTTGLRMPRFQTTIRPFSGTRDLLVKYVDSRGRERGPYNLQLDAQQSIITFSKEVLETTKPWLSFREHPEGHLMAYFTHILSNKSALKEIRYSVDNDSLSNRIRFSPPTRLGSSEISETDEMIVDVPPATRYVSVKLVFLDGTEWPAERVETERRET
jgi:hypothetical protein